MATTSSYGQHQDMVPDTTTLKTSCRKSNDT
ncbi:unnamed protein product, partial [Rotaria sp. Silwood2]